MTLLHGNENIKNEANCVLPTSHLTVVYSFLVETLFPGCSCNSWDTDTVTDVGFRCLAALPNLVSLAISYSAKLSDVALEAIASRGKLQKLVCRGCPSFTDVGCIRYINALFIVNIFYLYLLIIIIARYLISTKTVSVRAGLEGQKQTHRYDPTQNHFQTSSRQHIISGYGCSCVSFDDCLL
jgi:hypothetical protein